MNRINIVLVRVFIYVFLAIVIIYLMLFSNSGNRIEKSIYHQDKATELYIKTSATGFKEFYAFYDDGTANIIKRDNNKYDFYGSINISFSKLNNKEVFMTKEAYIDNFIGFLKQHKIPSNISFYQFRLLLQSFTFGKSYPEFNIPGSGNRIINAFVTEDRVHILETFFKGEGGYTVQLETEKSFPQSDLLDIFLKNQ